jgi:hypothetical protein
LIRSLRELVAVKINLKIFKSSVDILHELVFELPDRFIFNSWRWNFQIHPFAVVACVGNIRWHFQSHTFAKYALDWDVMVNSNDLSSANY